MGVSTIWFNGQFWVLTLEVATDDGIRATQQVLGPEPSEPQLYDLLNHIGGQLIAEAEAAPAVPSSRRHGSSHNPKRAARHAAKEQRRPSTASQEAIRLAHEAVKKDKRAKHRRRTAEEREEIRAKRRIRAHERHRGH